MSRRGQGISRLALALAALAIATPALAQPVTPQAELGSRKRAAEAWIQYELDRDVVPGAAVAVVHDQQVIFSAGFGYADRARRVPITAETAFGICSISKLFTSIAVMQLRDQGKIGLDESITDILPTLDFKATPPVSAEPITVRGLLSHTGGLQREAGSPYWSDIEFPNDTEMAKDIAGQPRLYTPFTHMQYSNLGMALLGEAVEKRSGQTFDSYVRQNILGPLGMTRTFTELPLKELGKGLAVGYEMHDGAGARKLAKPYQTNALAAAAGFAASPMELAKFASWQFRLLDAGKTEVLARPTLREMQRVHWHDPSDPESPMWGLGFFHTKSGDRSLIGHDGWCPGYRADFSLSLRDKVGAISMVNVNDYDPNRISRALIDFFAASAQAAAKPPEAPAKAPDATAPNLAAYEGLYVRPGYPAASYVVPTTTGLIIIGFDRAEPFARPDALEHSSGDTFKRKRRNGALGEEIRFERDAAGRVVKLWRHDQYLERKG